MRNSRTQFLGRTFTVALAAAFMLGAFELLGGFGFGDLAPKINIAEAAPATSITSISVSSTCDATGGFTGTITLNGTYTGTITLQTTYHVPGTAGFFPTGDTTTVTFSGQSSQTYAFATFTPHTGANTYRIEVVSASGDLGGLTVKSNSVPPCTPTPTTTTSTTTTTTTSTTTTDTTTTVSTTGTTT